MLEHPRYRPALSDPAKGTPSDAVTELLETALVIRARRYDANALSEIYTTYYPRVHHYLSIQLGDEHLAEDMASEVMLLMLESIERYRIQGSPFAAWLFRIARNRLIDHHRRTARHRQVALETSLPADGDSPLVWAERQMECDRVRAALERLPEPQRLVIVLKFMEDMDNSAVATVLGRSVGAVKGLQHRALQTMRMALERDGVEGRFAGTGSPAQETAAATELQTEG